MYVIVGLGNPEKKYNNTRHNVGFSIVDALSENLGITVNRMEHKALTGSGFHEGRKVMLVKPVTYMNLSGESVRLIVDYYDIDPASELLVIYDDVSMELGQLRIRKKGSAGGHNGIKSIIKHLGDDAFWRIKVGVGAPEGQKDMVAHVLGHFSDEEKREMDNAVDNAVKAALMMVADKNDEAMNVFNRKKEKPDESL